MFRVRALALRDYPEFQIIYYGNGSSASDCQIILTFRCNENVSWAANISDTAQVIPSDSLILLHKFGSCSVSNGGQGHILSLASCMSRKPLLEDHRQLRDHQQRPFFLFLRYELHILKVLDGTRIIIPGGELGRNRFCLILPWNWSKETLFLRSIDHVGRIFENSYSRISQFNTTFSIVGPLLLVN